MKATISEAEFSHDPAVLLDRVRRGDSFLIEQDGEVVASLEPVATPGVATWHTLVHALAGVPTGDVAFAADLEEIQRDQPDMPVNKWPR